jgi:hypothetical protein
MAKLPIKVSTKIEPKEPNVSPQLIEVSLADHHSYLTSIIGKGIIVFTDGKAMVSFETAALLRSQGFIK